MAKVNAVTAETIELLRGKIDFYLLRGILPVARTWPKKPKPPYTALQAEAMAVFAIANRSMHRLSDNIIKVWQSSTVGKRSSWTDIYRSIIMRFWKLNGTVAPIAIDYEIVETEITLQVVWDILQLYIDPETPEEIYEAETKAIPKTEVEKAQEPIYLTLRSDTGERLVAPYILLEL